VPQAKAVKSLLTDFPSLKRLISNFNQIKMSTSQINPLPTKPNTPTGKLVLILKNSRYTYAQFKTFHQTVIGMLEHGDLSSLNPAEQKNVIFFVNILISLLETPTATDLVTNSQCLGQRKNLAALKQFAPPGQCGNLKHLERSGTVRLNHSEADLLILLHWIKLVVQRKEMTIETLLDEFFALQLNTPYN
jgi:hypothetical protein